MTPIVGHDPHRHLHAPAEEAEGSRAGDRRGTSEMRLQRAERPLAEPREPSPEVAAFFREERATRGPEGYGMTVGRAHRQAVSSREERRQQRIAWLLERLQASGAAWAAAEYQVGIDTGRHGAVRAALKNRRDKAEQTFKDIVARLGHATLE
jgi:hypothetical protein